MKKTIYVLVFLIAGSACGAEDMPPYYNSVSGIISPAMFFELKSDLSFGKPYDCHKKIVIESPLFESYRCGVEGAVFKINMSDGKFREFSFNKLIVFVKTVGQDVINEYIFSGTMTQDQPVPLTSATLLVLSAYTKSPQILKGYFEITELKSSSTLYMIGKPLQ